MGRFAGKSGLKRCQTFTHALVRGPSPPASTGGMVAPRHGAPVLPRRVFAAMGDRKRGQMRIQACCDMTRRSAFIWLSLVRAASPLFSPVDSTFPLPGRACGAVCAAARLGEVTQGCGNMPAHSACPTKWPHFRTFPPLSILSHVFQNCPRPYMPWRKINFQCNTHREIHVQNMFFWCQKKNNK